MKLTTDSGISQEFPLPTFREISHEIWKVAAEIYLGPQIQ
jgi:hypothetical protein